MNPATTIFQEQFDAIRPNLLLPESEESWDSIARSVTALATVCKDVDSYAPVDLVVAMRSVSRPLISAMNSERSRLSGAAIDLVAVVASCLGVAFDPLLPHFFPVLLVLSGRTSKVTVARARTCILTIIEATHLPPVLSYLMQSVTDKSVSLRLTVVESTLACMNCFNPPDLEKDARAKDIEVIVRTTARDANADVRKVSKKVFEAYKLLLPGRLESFTTPLTPTTRKYLDIQNKADKLKPSRSHPMARPKAAHLSASTSAVRASSSRRPQTHARSASSPNVAPDVGTLGTNDQPPPHIRAKADMPLPKPLDDSQSSRQTAVVRSTSVVDRKRVVSMFAAVRPVLPNTKLGVSERARPTPTSNSSALRPQLVLEARQPPPTTSVVARRVPVSEAQSKLDVEKAIRAHGRIDSSVSTPAIRHAPPSLAEASKPSAPRAPNKDGASGPRAIGKLKSTEPNKQRSLMQPTLAQISRVKTIERRLPVPTAPKPLKGKTAPRKAQVPPGKGEQPAPTLVVTPASDGPTIASSPASNTSPNSTEPDLCDTESQEDPACTRATHTPSKQESEMLNAAEHTGKSRDPEIRPGPSRLLTTPPKEERNVNPAMDKTPISELLLSIERGFLFTPSAPLSPPQSYLPLASATLPIPFPLKTVWTRSEQQNEELGEIVSKEVIGRPESRRALGDVGINK